MRPVDPTVSPAYAELTALSNFSFLEGTSHPDELVEQAKALGLAALAVADRHTMAGVVRAHVAAKEQGIALAVGVRCVFALDGAGELALPHDPSHLEVVLLAEGREGYARLCRLLTLGKRRAGWTRDMAVSAQAAEAECDAVASSACHLWLLDLLDASVQALGCGEPGEWAGRVPEAERPLAPFALPGVHAIVLPPRGFGAMSERFLEALRWLRGVLDGDRLSLALMAHGEPDDALRLAQMEWLSHEVGVPLVAANEPRCHVRERQELQDVVSCIREGCTLRQARRREAVEPLDLAEGRRRCSAAAHGVSREGPVLLPTAEWHMKGAQDMLRALAAAPQEVCEAALARSVEVALRCARFSLDELRYRYPSELVPEGRTAMEHLRDLAERGAAERYPEGVPERVRAQLGHEFAIIADLEYAPYFLTVHSIVDFARSRGILCQGRGAAANSVVCYCLGVTAVDPMRVDMLFERFVSRERNEPPDIDVDFEHERREEVIQFIYRTYGRARAALCAEVVCYRGKSALREVAKALGMREVGEMGQGGAAGADGEEGAEGAEGAAQVHALAAQLEGFPRHLSQHVGGFVITHDPVCELVPVRNATMSDRTIIEWDKDDIEAMGMLKVDVLALGMLTAIRKALEIGAAHPAHHPLENGENGAVGAWHHFPHFPCAHLFPRIPAEDPAVYDMCCAADTVGVFQIESRAQMSMLPRLRPRCYYDLVIQVAIVRPGPIQGDMVHPYLRRRNGEEPVVYPNAIIERVLGKTLGVPLFQEQAMSLAIHAAGFTPGQADELRRAIGAWKRRGNQLERFRQMLEGGMLARGYSQAFAKQVFTQVQGFSGYGFPESHAASFAHIVYVSAWLKRHWPAAFTAALLNSQPMGFYAPAQLVRDAHEHGVEIRPVDVHRSDWDCTVEPDPDAPGTQPALRLGLRMVSGLRESSARAVLDAVRREGPFTTIESLWRASRCGAPALRRLALADAFGSMGLARQQALWQVRALRDEPAPVLDAGAAAAGTTLFDMRPQPLPAVPMPEQVALDYATTGLSLKAHPMVDLRERLDRRGALRCADLQSESRAPTGQQATIAGLVLCRQRPATASGVVFITLEDESGAANLVVWNRTWQRYRSVARHATALEATGTVERRSGVTHLIVRRLVDLTAQTPVGSHARDFR
jgi:error-prone DNA polymerase